VKLQGSVLGPILFLLFINDLIECYIPHSDIYLFADDAKLFRHIIQDSDKTALQKGVNALQEWTQEWLLKLNASKCMVMSFGRYVEKSYTYNILENSQIKPLAQTDQIKDLGILLDERLSFRDHINDKINKAFSMLGIIKRNFKHLTIQSFTMLYKNMVRSHLDYCSSVWSPYMKKDIEALEKVQKRATKILPQLKHMYYSDRLKACKLPLLHYRRIRGDMIETYK